jgi:ABC-type transport system involved in multi-copper enzyme maturation permease subunit
MKSLLWKDCRLNALVLAFGVATWLGPYLVGALRILLGGGPRVAIGLRWAFMLEPASVISLEASLIPLLLLGANAIARERSDRSAEFLAYLPSTRARILASKAAVPLAFASLVWATGLLAIFVLMPALGGEKVGLPPGLAGAVATASTVLFGTVWLGSSFADTPLTAVGFSMGLSLLLGLAMQASNYLLGWTGPGNAIGPYWSAGSAVIVGISCFVAGSWLYLRRIEP